VGRHGDLELMKTFLVVYEFQFGRWRRRCGRTVEARSAKAARKVVESERGHKVLAVSRTA
jgi:hypothetical protein